MLNVAQPRIDPFPTVSSAVIWTKGKVNLAIPRNPAKPQITLLRAGLFPIGQGALVVTGGPVGTAPDGTRCSCVLCGWTLL